MASTNTLKELLARNSKFAESYTSPPNLIPMAQAVRASGAGLIILSCSDPRLNPYQVFGIDATIKGVTMVRNAGGRALDAIRTISVLQSIANPRTIVVLHHTDCGLVHFHDADVKKALIEIAPAEEATINASKYGEIATSVEDSLKEDVELLRTCPFIQPGTNIVGIKYDIHTGVATQLEEVQVGS